MAGISFSKFHEVHKAPVVYCKLLSCKLKSATNSFQASQLLLPEKFREKATYVTRHVNFFWTASRLQFAFLPRVSSLGTGLVKISHLTGLLLPSHEPSMWYLIELSSKWSSTKNHDEGVCLWGSNNIDVSVRCPVLTAAFYRQRLTMYLLK